MPRSVGHQHDLALSQQPWPQVCHPCRGLLKAYQRAEARVKKMTPMLAPHESRRMVLDELQQLKERLQQQEAAAAEQHRRLEERQQQQEAAAALQRQELAAVNKTLKKLVKQLSRQ